MLDTMARDLSRTYIVCMVCNTALLGVESYRQHRLELHNAQISGTLLSLMEKCEKKKWKEGKSEGESTVLVDKVVSETRQSKQVKDVENSSQIVPESNVSEFKNSVKLHKARDMEVSGSDGKAGSGGDLDLRIKPNLVKSVAETVKTRLEHHDNEEMTVIQEGNYSDSGKDEWAITSDMISMAVTAILTEEQAFKMKSNRRSKQKMEYSTASPFGNVKIRPIKRPRVNLVSKKAHKKHHVEVLVPLTVAEKSCEGKRHTTELVRLGVTDSTLLEMLQKPAGRNLREKRKRDEKELETEKEIAKSDKDAIRRSRKQRRKKRRTTNTLKELQQFQCPTCQLQFICDDHLQYHIKTYHTTRMNATGLLDEGSIDDVIGISSNGSSRASVEEVSPASSGENILVSANGKSRLAVEVISQASNVEMSQVLVDETPRNIMIRSEDNIPCNQQSRSNSNSSLEAALTKSKYDDITRNWNLYSDSVVVCKTCNRLLASIMDFHVHYERNHATPAMPEMKRNEIIVN